MFGHRLDLAVEYGDLLAGEGVRRGLIGPREVPRLWERHLLNSAVLAELLPPDARFVDVGAGAGLPGVPLAICRPDLRVDLVEPMLRRTAFLNEVVGQLGLAAARVVRGRAEDRDVRALVAPTDWVVVRAVAPLVRLVEWCMPLLSPGGRLLALKGSRAADEIASARQTLRRQGAADPVLRQLTAGSEPTWVVEVRRSTAWPVK